MSGVWDSSGCVSWLLIGLMVGYGLAWLHVNWIDSKRRYAQQQVEDAAREGVLAEGRANQARWDEMSAA